MTGNWARSEPGAGNATIVKQTYYTKYMNESD